MKAPHLADKLTKWPADHPLWQVKRMVCSFVFLACMFQFRHVCCCTGQSISHHYLCRCTRHEASLLHQSKCDLTVQIWIWLILAPQREDLALQSAKSRNELIKISLLWKASMKARHFGINRKPNHILPFAISTYILVPYKQNPSFGLSGRKFG